MSETETGALGGGRIESRELEQEMRSSFLDYAMSVIVARALPDVRDGLKPVHRRVLYSMWANGNRPGRPYVKSREHRRLRDGQPSPARRLGDLRHARPPRAAVLAALPARRRPGQLRLDRRRPGSRDALHRSAPREARRGDALASSTRTRSTSGPNYDESKQEPLVLPARFPNLLVNGSAGIAVGMATNMPPHHLGETIDAVVALIDNPDANVEDLMKHVKGPDFPTGAIIVGRSGIRDAYRTGRGRVVMRARAHIEELRGGKSAIIVTELPYGVKQGRRQRRDQEDRRPRPREGDHRGLRPRRPQRPHRHADPDRAQARRGPAGRAEQALQAHRRCRRPSATTRSRSSTASRGRSRCSSSSRTTSTSSARSSRAARSTSCARPSAAPTSSAAT